MRVRLAAAAVFAPVAIGPASAFADGEIRLVVDRYRGAREVFRIHLAEPRIELLPEERVQRLPDHHDRWAARGKAGRAIEAAGGIRPSAADFSPGCARVLLQYNDARGKELKPPEFGSAAPWREAGEFALRSGWTLFDSAWSADGRYLVVLERNERVKKTPGSMIRWAFGHGDILASFGVAVIDTASGAVRRLPVAEDIQGIANFLTPLASCSNP